MGYGGYSSTSRNFRAKSSKAAKLMAADIVSVKHCLSGSFDFTEAGDGSLLVNLSSMADMDRIRSSLASAGLSGVDISGLDDRMTGYSHRSGHAVFDQRQINNAMSPYGVTVRESRDSVDHPNSVAIILALDETGSMGSVPHYLVKEGLPAIMERIIKGGVPDPQVLFLGIGDHECDQAPLQVGQFESNDELLDKWLTNLYLEGRGGGNDGESYLLAWYFAAFHTAIDCFEKRGRKGYLITIGDEPVLPRLPARVLQTLMGPGQYEDYTAVDLISRASEKYRIFHINVLETRSGSRQEVADGWKQLLSDGLIMARRREDVAEIVAGIALSGEQPSAVAPDLPAGHQDEEMML